MRRAQRLAAIGGVFLLPSSAALAQSICNAHYPIRATGAACSSGNAVGHITRPTDGLVVCCIAAPSYTSPRGNFSVPSGNRYAAGMALGLAGAGIVLDLINLFGPLFASEPEDPQRGLEEQATRERADMRREAARWYEAALREVKKGDMRSAEGFLIKAGRLAENASDWATRDRYERELAVVRATRNMMEGLAFEAEGKFSDAAKWLDQAAFYAEKTGNKELTRRIREYREAVNQKVSRRGLRDRYQLGPPPKITDRSTCMEVNGKMVCE